ncbi:MAG TPA: hypothetical protein EYQ83_13315 [Acidobacteria bacterium]|nr:hypothetical protein [Acidobacteriota bacterium]
MAALEQRLLGGFSAAVVLAGVLVTLGELPSTGGGETVARSGVLAVMAAIAVLLQARSTWRLSHIRVVEAATFLTLTLIRASDPAGRPVFDAAASVR